jgi:hypothetical protein
MAFLVKAFFHDSLKWPLYSSGPEGPSKIPKF